MSERLDEVSRSELMALFDDPYGPDVRAAYAHWADLTETLGSGKTGWRRLSNNERQVLEGALPAGGIDEDDGQYWESYWVPPDVVVQVLQESAGRPRVFGVIHDPMMLHKPKGDSVLKGTRDAMGVLTAALGAKVHP